MLPNALPAVRRNKARAEGPGRRKREDEMKTETLDMTKIPCGQMKLDLVNCQRIKRLGEHEWNTLAEYLKRYEEVAIGER